MKEKRCENYFRLTRIGSRELGASIMCAWGSTQQDRIISIISTVISIVRQLLVRKMWHIQSVEFLDPCSGILRQ